MQRNIGYLQDILDSAGLDIRYLNGKTKREVLIDTQLQDSVIRRLEVIGEGARRIPPETRHTLPDLPWKAMIGLRNVMIHEYDAVVTVVWDTVRRDLPPLVATIKKILPPPAGS